jgi:hypothetical protein
MSAPRPTGLSRTALLLLISLHLYTFLKNDNKKLSNFILIILAGTIYMLAARSSILLLAIYIFTHFFFCVSSKIPTISNTVIFLNI